MQQHNKKANGCILRVSLCHRYHLIKFLDKLQKYSKNTKQDVFSGISDSAASAAESKLTDAQVKQARKDLKAQGLNEKAFTDEQVRQVILRAKHEGKSVKQVADEFK